MELNWKNLTMWTGDNLDIMRGMNSESVDLIYLDPPFNSKHNYAAPIGSEAAGAEFKDTWTLNEIDEAWHGLIADQNPDLYKVIDATMTKSDKAYLIYMAVRIMEMKRLLKSTGSIYLHCDSTMSHYLKIVMDAIFGRTNFRNEIAWCYKGPGNVHKQFPRKHDTILFYARSKDAKFNRDAIRIPYHPETIARRGRLEGSKSFTTSDQASPARRSTKTVQEVFGKGKLPEDWWPDIPILTNQRERVGYPTQKPLALLARIIKASTNEGDMILDPFCGCATACVAAERWSRQWAGIDISSKAADLVKMRREKELGLYGKIIIRTDIPMRSDLGKLPNYRKHKHYLFGKQEGICAGCRVTFLFRNFTVDHIVPRSKGGHDGLDNLQLLCGACNNTKGDRDQAYLVAKLKKDHIL